MLFTPQAVDEIDRYYQARRPDQVVRAVASCLAGVRPVEISAHWHPLGFFRIELPVRADGHRYMLHSWPRGERRGEPEPWPVHCHAWLVESLVLAGRIRDVQFRRVHSRGTLRGPLYVASNIEGASRLDRTADRVELAVERDVTTESGEFYSIAAHTFHSSDISVDEHCVTLARLGPRTGEKAYILGDKDGPSMRVIHAVPVAADALAVLIRDVRESAARAGATGADP